MPLPPEAAAIPEEESLYLSELKSLLTTAVHGYLNSKIPMECDEDGKILKVYWNCGEMWAFYGPIERDRATKRVLPRAERNRPYTNCTVGVRCKIYAHGAEKLEPHINEDGCLQIDWLPVPKYRNIRVTWTGK